jgi:hypothetical protein
MTLSEQELREMVRTAIAKTAPPAMPAPAEARVSAHVHASHGLLALVGGGDSEGRCLIEPAVPCTHCGYCQSLGH